MTSPQPFPAAPPPVEQPPAPDRLDTLNRRAWLLRWRASDVSIAVAERADAACVDETDSRHARALLRARRTRAWHMKWRGRFEEAESHCRAALGVTPHADDPDTTAEVLSILSVLLYSKGRHERAGELVQQGLGLLDAESRPEARIDLLISNSTIHRYIDNVDAADRFLTTALDLAASSGLVQEEARIHSNIARLHYHLSAFDAAHEHARRSLDLARASRNRVIEPYSLELLGAASIHLGRLEEAHAWLGEGERIALALGDQRSACQLLRQRARAWLDGDAPEAALEACQRGERIAELMNYPLWLRHFKRIESNAHEVMGNAAAALTAYKAYAQLDAATYREEASERLLRAQTELSDATERELATERARAQVEEQKAYLETTLAAMSDAAIMMDDNQRVSAYNERMYDLMHIPRSVDLLGLDLESVVRLHGDLAGVRDDVRERVVERRRALSAGETPEGPAFRIATSLLDGTPVEFTRTPVGSGGAAVMTLRDVSEDVARLAEQKLRLETTLQNMTDGVMMLDGNRIITALNTPLCETFRVNPAEVGVGDTVRHLMASQRHVLMLDDPADREAAVNDALDWCERFFGEPGDVFRHQLRRGGRVLEVTSVNLNDGSLVVTVHDATESERLRQSEQERAELAERLSHAQRLQALGELTGGVAHDFNNLLAVIMGNAELLKLRVGADIADGESIEAVLRAAEHGAELTRRLLAFSRKQSLRPRSLDLFAKVSDMEAMLRRTLGETVVVRVVPTTGLWRCVADPGHLENALLNLVVNARDAMPGGGTLTIECDNVQLDEDYAARHAEVSAGEYVVVSITDSGIGMTAASVSRAFEPFYSTKDVGRGSGLGLSMVYGFVKQSGGHVTLYSEHGLGTTARIYLPRADATTPDESPPAPIGVLPRAGRGEHVVLVEDDAGVRDIVLRTLEGLGYRVSAFADGAAALAALDRLSAIDGLLTDVVLPGGLNGPDVARRFHAQHPDLAVLYMSGYTRATVGARGGVPEGATVLAKPFAASDLATALRRALEPAASS